MIDMKNRRT